MKISNPTAVKGEEVASKYLQDKGYGGEIDIVATYQNTLVFVEVKTRTTGLFGGAIEAIAYHKLKSLIKTVQFYKISHPKLLDLLRIDAVLIDIDNNKVKNINQSKTLLLKISDLIS